MTHWWLLTVIIVVVVAVVTIRAYWFPLQRCPRCKDRVAGSGAGSTSKAFNLRCRKCGNTGRRVRPLAKFLRVPLRDKEK
jgi:tRNA(Ile2) C34 agmatinyltransferase TiaS